MHREVVVRRLASGLVRSACVLLACGASAASDRWTPLPGPFGGPVNAVALSPRDPQRVWLGSGSGVWSSDDRGASWRFAGLAGQRIDSIAVDPVVGRPLYVGTGTAVYRTGDDGATWTRVGADLGSVSLLSVAGAGSATALYVTNGNALLKTLDGGASWVTVLTQRSLAAMTVCADHSEVLYATDRRALWTSLDAGATWSAHAWPAASAGGLDMAYGIASDPERPETVYAWGYGGLLRSGDGGTRWQRILVGVDVGVFAAGRDGGLLAAGFDGQVHRSVDGGASWAERPLDPSFGIGCYAAAFPMPTSAMVDPSDPRAAFICTSNGVYATRDGGASWVASNAGLAATSVTSLDVDPTDGTLFVGAYEWGAFSTADDGASWRPMRMGLPSGYAGEEYTPAFWINAVRRDPSVSSRLWAATTWGLFASDDGGDTWAQGGQRTWLSSLLLSSPWSGAMLAGTGVGLGGTWATGGCHGCGVWSSGDAGRAWSNLSGSLGDNVVQCLAADPANPALILAGSKGHVLRSADGGATWQASGGDVLPPVGASVASLAFVGSSSRRVLAGAAGAVYASDDAGLSWYQTAFQSGRPDSWPSQVTIVACDGQHPGACYVSDPEGVFRTLDGGASWFAYSEGLTHTEVWSLAIDPVRGKLYAGTRGGGVFVIQPTPPPEHLVRRRLGRRVP